MKLQLNNQVAIVTGATSGIGRAICLVMAEAGAQVVAVGRSAERLSEVGERLPNGLTLQLDVRSEADMTEMANCTIDRFGRIDILVASAGIAKSPSRKIPTPLAQLPEAEWQEVIETNLNGVFLSNRAVLPAMIQQHSGNILNISSFPAGLSGQPYASAYSASKFGVRGLSEALQEEVRGYGIRVQILLPGPTDTAIFGDSAAARFGPLMPVEHVAEVALKLLSLPSDTTMPAVVVRSEPQQTASSIDRSPNI